ncbi:MAG: cation:proton antiporter [Hydrococcus sp. CSU_1_8]|nr:cation:proton antiporter [Hydrococcus sp. CSU_1_8]
MKIVSMDVMSTGVVSYYVLMASREGLFAPIGLGCQKCRLCRSRSPGSHLNGDVIGFSIQALMLVGVMKLARDNPTLESHEIEKNNTP